MSTLSTPAPRPLLTGWMSGRWGLMVHWIYPTILPETPTTDLSFDQTVDAFDVACFLAEFEQSGAEWLIWTIGQNTGFYSSPNSVLESLAGSGHASKRDLTLEIARGVKAQGKRFIAYLPGEMAFNPTLKDAFGWRDECGPEQRQFQLSYCNFLREYSERLGALCDGWWIDGAWIFPIGALDFSMWARASRRKRARCFGVQ